MQIWLDTVNLDLIEKVSKIGLFDGVTTNPSSAAKSGMALEDLLEKILGVQRGPVAVQVTAQDADGMVQQATALKSFADRIVIKIPATKQGFQAIASLGPQLPVMATAIYDPLQALLAAKSGAAFVAPYFSKIIEEGGDGMAIVRQTHSMLSHYEEFTTKLLVASVHSVDHVREFAEIGVPAATLGESLLRGIIEKDHPLTLKSLEQFSADWQKAEPRKSLPL